MDNGTRPYPLIKNIAPTASHAEHDGDFVHGHLFDLEHHEDRSEIELHGLEDLVEEGACTTVVERGVG